MARSKTGKSLPTAFERVSAALGFVLVAGAALLIGRPRAAGAPIKAPLDIQAPGWRRIAGRVWSEFNADQIPQIAGGVAYFALLSVFPAMAAFVSLYGLFADVGQVPRHLALMAGILPRSALALVADEMTRLAGGKHAPLGFALAISLVLSLLSANGAVKAMFNGLNTAYEARENRGLVRLNLISLAFTIGGIAAALAGLGLVVAAPQALRAMGWKGGIDPLLVSILRWPVLLAASSVGLALLYRFGPARPRAGWRWITPGSVFASLAWLVVSMGFSWYVANFGHYERTYGSLGAVVGFMIWLWLSSIVILVGAEVNAEIEAEAGARP